ncbi:hypothetical protein [Mesorhizobium sp. ZC-5]|uniref:hypothetical protein n=1 Tax=Mesorhizobium sp. ZC-5 TaxID=2986066 RepID=UPI0021E8C00C|nr:hypothetical protein [Mesorhizobium sp. ZC-5]MCV3241790.1 hypothetical protein [Mesorhizobium sp. ZC-5]
MRKKSHTGLMPAKVDADTQDGFSNDSPSSGKPSKAANASKIQKTGDRSSPSPDPAKVSGAGPAVAEHSKDAKAPKSGRQAGAYVKE